MNADLKAALDEFNRGVTRARNAYRAEHAAGRHTAQVAAERARRSQRYFERKEAEK